ncbi:toprim domain-containing protein [Aneurinibacillus terranovensis]|uniref:toprim domain-containing protein n=1 Tax=Aneurinibacillus terranovensis TaxID=278991 RepID=UPI000422067C|nr:toprim domain-containing protein [Aneurinibacillus terranovensis]
MLAPSIITYIETFILKSAEQLELTNKSNPGSPFIDVNIIKRTERTYRVVGVLTLASNVCNDASADSSTSSTDVSTNQEESPDEELTNINFMPRKKVKLDDRHPTTLRWLEKGWIIKEVRFKKDEKTIDSMHYRMGYRLHKYQADQVQQKKDALAQEFQTWKKRAALLECTWQIEQSEQQPEQPEQQPEQPEQSEQIKQPDQIEQPEQQMSHTRQKGVQSLLNMINETYWEDLHELEVSPLFPSKWPMQKRLKFLHFVLAFLQLCVTKTDFDWKEIGASYYKKIGGSKEFDLNKEEFIAWLEDWAQCPAALLGLTSLGKITPLYFSGEIAGRFSTYHFGPVHALTDLSISEDDYSTTAATLWLVENRAVLTRMAAEKDFMKKTNSLVVCVDGHLRTSHKQCIGQLLKNSSLKNHSLRQVIIWTDYDPDGLQIAKELYLAISQAVPQAVSQAISQAASPYGIPILTLKWITHDHEVIANWQHYEDYMIAFLKHQKAEQEQVVGGVEDWKKWIGR